MTTLAGAAPVRETRAAVTWLLNLAHAIDHMFLLIFATAVATMAAEFGRTRWEDLMPLGAGAFVMFGLGALPAGRLGDLWGRRQMMLVFFGGMGLSSLLVAFTQSAWQLAAALTLLGTFASIYHPVGIPMLVQHARSPGATIGLNGLSGNLGIAAAALVTGYLVKWFGWRMAFAVPGLACLACGLAFAWLCPRETEPPSRRAGKAKVTLTQAQLARAFLVMTAAAATGGLLFNMTTNANTQLMTERFRGVLEDPALLGILLSVVYAIASLAQVVVGRLIDRMPLKPLYFRVALLQIPLLVVAAYAHGWLLFAALVGVMVSVFGAIPFTDAMIVRYVDDRLRSRVAGMRLAVGLGISSLAVWALGPVVKGVGFDTMLLVLAGIASITATIVNFLPEETAA
ncbi:MULTISPECIES: MFS transporter [Ramlibacter]|uniref:MFS transporter n=1 Tax=Ramlibacter pinisoli TaxID=2682844 RepID=A0A6N8IV30_9BURK|nr:MULTISPECIES: MFS transporter [Ramlibacter]MBA2960847.1 MFS transporter [Ramlibacter sp. CGMCC 1.13660]MVQ30794.1 MFS transporter [Ramlibacter pinisoli]